MVLDQCDLRSTPRRDHGPVLANTFVPAAACGSRHHAEFVVEALEYSTVVVQSLTVPIERVADLRDEPLTNHELAGMLAPLLAPILGAPLPLSASGLQAR